MADKPLPVPEAEATNTKRTTCMEGKVPQSQKACGQLQGPAVTKEAPKLLSQEATKSHSAN